jgi:hypothetical protein
VDQPVRQSKSANSSETKPVKTMAEEKNKKILLRLPGEGRGITVGESGCAAWRAGAGWVESSVIA